MKICVNCRQYDVGSVFPCKTSSGHIWIDDFQPPMVYDWASISEELGVLRWRTGEDAQTIARLEAANRELAEKVERIERKLINAKYGEGLEFNVRKILLEEFGGASLV